MEARCARMVRWSLVAGLVANTAAAHAGDVVLQERPDGSTVITDAPGSGEEAESGEPVESGSEGAATPAPRSTSRPAADAAPPGSPDHDSAPDYSLTIREPSADAVIWADDARLRVAVVAEPELASDHRLRVSLGDHASATVAGAGEVEIHPVHRGSHPLVAEVIGPDGRTLAQTAPRTIHVKQHSRLHPGRAD